MTVSRQRAWQLRKAAAGLCIGCGKRPRLKPHPDLCLACLEARRAGQKAAYDRKKQEVRDAST